MSFLFMPELQPSTNNWCYSCSEDIWSCSLVAISDATVVGRVYGSCSLVTMSGITVVEKILGVAA